MGTLPTTPERTTRILDRAVVADGIRRLRVHVTCECRCSCHGSGLCGMAIDLDTLDCPASCRTAPDYHGPACDIEGSNR